ncbi:hypothetical protein BEH94_00020 [Candidatus Altiarchaeales archaeon WOR_SM1_SCG]|nr:hypothetical protein BEH94_00020 [Candidatus Altiarchaeales archaeon WOR_SM1_SCG]
MEYLIFLSYSIILRFALVGGVTRHLNKILVTSGIGAREYYRKFGYGRDGVYMGKRLKHAI